LKPGRPDALFQPVIAMGVTKQKSGVGQETLEFTSSILSMTAILCKCGAKQDRPALVDKSRRLAGRDATPLRLAVERATFP
jgi:hypothetical protein